VSGCASSWLGDDLDDEEADEWSVGDE